MTHRVDPANPDADRCRIKDGTKNGEQRTVTIPPHVRDAVKTHLTRHVALGPDALLFAPNRGGGHLDDRVFNKDVLQRAAKAVGVDDISVHDLRHFAGTQNARVSPLAENMARLGHKTVGAAMRCQHSEDGADAKLAAALSVNVLAELAADSIVEVADSIATETSGNRWGNPRATLDSYTGRGRTESWRRRSNRVRRASSAEALIL